MLEYLPQKGGVCTDGKILDYAPGVTPQPPSRWRTSRGPAKVGQFPNPRGEVAPGGDVGEPTAKPGVGQESPEADRGALGTADKCQR
jgi:hypothetical protein